MLQRAFSCLMNVFSESSLREGMKYVKQEGMLSVRLSDGLLHARIKGSMGRLYDVYIDLKTWPTSTSRCLCDAHFNCEHAAASLLALRLKAMDNQKASSGLERLDSWIQAYQNEILLEDVISQTHNLYYYLDFHPTSFAVQLAVARTLKKGGIGKTTWLDRLEQVKPAYKSAEDSPILEQLALLDEGRGGSQTTLLTHLLNCGRALDREMIVPWHLGQSKSATIEWVVEPDGVQHWILHSKHARLQPCWLDEVWYSDIEHLEVGRIEHPYAKTSIQFLREHLFITPDLLAEKIDEFSHFAPDAPPPIALTEAISHSVPPKAVVMLDVIEAEMGTKPSHGILNFAFEYEHCRVNFNETRSCIYKQQGDTLYKITRDLEFERSFKELCIQAFPLQPVGFDLTDIEGLACIQTNFIPWVEELQARIELNHPIYAKVLSEEEIEWYGELENQGDFFAYELGVLVEGKKVNLVPILIHLFTEYQLNEWENFTPDHIFRLNVGTNQILPITYSRIKPFIEFLLFEGGKYRHDENAFKLKRYQWVIMQESLNALSASLRRQLSHETMVERLHQLLDRQTLPMTPLPEAFQASLRDYQQHGLDWLQALRACGFGGVLADDMGLGKTVQALAHLMVEKQAGRMVQPSLIIAPLSLVGNWLAEAHRFAPTLKVLIYHGVDRQAHVFEDYDVVISTYGLVQRDKAIFLKQNFYYLILDEAQWIKNARAQTTLMVQQIQASFRLCLSGTPFENHLGELWSLFNFIMPGVLVERSRFKTYFQDPIEKQGDVKKKEVLMKRVQPFLLRRTKQQVAQELPEKTIMVRNVRLVDTQRDLYELIRLSMEKRVRDSIAQYGLVKSHMVFLDALLKLRQVCCDPRLLSLPIAKRAHGVSAKLESLMELLETLVEEGRRILLFSQFTSMLAIIEEAVKAKGYPYLKLTGQTRNRQAIVDEFQESTVPLFLMSLKAGGVGLNLTKADTVIHYDPWWNPAVEDQATDRTHRLGQLNPVFVYRLVAEGTVEEAMMLMQSKKRALFEGVLSDQQLSGTKLTEEDLSLFFQPLE
jgi:superfamily II DNA or RNA helicase